MTKQSIQQAPSPLNSWQFWNRSRNCLLWNLKVHHR